MAIFATIANQPVDMRLLWPAAGGSDIVAVAAPSSSLMRVTRSDGYVVEYRSADANLSYSNAVPPVLTSGVVTSVFLYDALGTRIATLTNISVALTTLYTTAPALGLRAADSITGSVASDILTGGAGNDTVNGGTGTDTMIYSGTRGNYRIERLSDGTTRVTDLRVGGPDGVDILTSIERLQFANMNIENPAYAGSLTPAKTGGEKTFNTITTGDQFGGDLAITSNGGIAVTHIDRSLGSNGRLMVSFSGSASPATFDANTTVLSVDNSGRRSVESSQTGTDPAVIRIGFNNIQISAASANNQLNPFVEDLQDGRSVVVWQDGDALRGRFLVTSGLTTIVSGQQFTVLASGATGPALPAVVALDGSNYAVAYQSQTAEGTDIFIRFFNSNKATTASIAVNDTTLGEQTTVSAIQLLNGTVAVVWTDASSGAGHIAARLLNDDGTFASGEFVVDSDLTVSDSEPAVTALNDGRFVIVWAGHDGLVETVRGQVFNADGSRWGDEFRASTTSGLDISDVDVATFPDGRIAVSWTYGGGGTDGDGSGAGIKLQVFDPRLTAIDFTGTPGADQAVGTTFADIMRGNDGADALKGMAGNDSMFGGSGNDTLDGGAGLDTMTGGFGNDTYIVDNTGDEVFEDLDGGNDVIRFTSFLATGGFFAPHVETYDFSLLPAGATINMSMFFDYVGTAFDDTFVDANRLPTFGNTGEMFADVLDGGDGIDTLDLSALSGSLDFILTLDVPETDPDTTGTRLVRNIENVIAPQSTRRATITGNDSDNHIVGNAGSDVLSGSGGDDTLEGGAGNDTFNPGGPGADTMIGGLGNDVYNLFGSNNVIVELAGEGDHDAILADVSVTAAMSANIEEITLRGFIFNLNLNAVGDGNANLITGNSGNNQIDGGGGADDMRGGGGNDAYVVDNAGDVITELTAGGFDSVLSSAISLNLTSYANVENATLAGSLSLSVTGNSGDNTLTGNSGSNAIVGGGGTDTMFGGSGNDTFTVDDNTDAVFENINGGTDRVVSSVISLNLASYSNVENISLTGASNLSATGSDVANSIGGNSGNNRISGLGGADVLGGGAGLDTFVYVSTSDSTDTVRDLIGDFNSAAQDKFDFSAIDAISGGGLANDTFAFIGGAAFSAAGQVRFQFDPATGLTTVFVNTDSTLTTAEMVINLKGNVILDLADFFL